MTTFISHRRPPESVGPAEWSEVAPTLRNALTEAIHAKRWPIYLFGPAGRGKSCAACCVYLRWSGSARWFETHQIVADVLNCRSNGRGYIVRTTAENSFDEWESTIVRKVQEAGLVCFDDVGMRKPTDPAFEVFFGLVNLRRGRPTIFTGNLSGKELTAAYDARIASRILSGSVIQVGGDDRRQAGMTFVKA
jgi:DNA replication protein DnaC